MTMSRSCRAPARPRARGIPAARCCIGALAVSLAAGPGAPGAAAAQQDQAGQRTEAWTEGWNAPRALALAQRAIERRRRPTTDTTLLSYRADARGWVYFYLDRETTGERTLIKVDQVALEVFWRQPGLTKQRIIGLRDRSRIPNTMHYHLDHLTVVQNEFGDRIRMGDGDEVRDVPHPAAPGADTIYDYRLADSLSLYLPGAASPVRVYEVQVRPERTDRAAIIGSLFLDRATAEIVRLDFTFTPVSYVDDRLDYIHVSLENGLWEGRHWLPYEQRVELRRQLPVLDFPAGAVIRARFNIRNYVFNEPLSPGFFAGPRVVAVPPDERRAFRFEEGLYADLEEEGLAAGEDLESLRDRAREIAREGALSGLPRLRLAVPSASAALRYGRAEGLFLGAGIGYRTRAGPRLLAGLGWAFGPDALALSGGATLRLDAGALRGRLELDAFRNRSRDLGHAPAMAGALNSLSAALFGKDYVDPYYASGLALRHDLELDERWDASIGVGWEAHRPAALTTRGSIFGDSTAPRPVIAVPEGDLLEGAVQVSRTLGSETTTLWRAEASLLAGDFDGDAFVRPRIRVEADRAFASQGGALRGELDAGIALGEPPPQRVFLVGGRGTLAGYPFRAYAGDRFATLRLEATRQILDPWLSVRLIAAAGWASFSAESAPPGPWTAGTDGVLPALGAGVGLVSEILRVDAARGLADGGRWELVVSARPDLRGIL
ncbi:MAG: hypothetical protein ACRELV_05835 [Longimicrobiales bacterium]